MVTSIKPRSMTPSRSANVTEGLLLRATAQACSMALSSGRYGGRKIYVAMPPCQLLNFQRALGWMVSQKLEDGLLGCERWSTVMFLAGNISCLPGCLDMVGWQVDPVGQPVLLVRQPLVVCSVVQKKCRWAQLFCCCLTSGRIIPETLTMINSITKVEHIGCGILISA